MKLTNKGRYAVMAMADLASNANNGPISLSEISLRQNISLPYLEQIFIKLKDNKLVRSSRGATGGYILEKPASEIKNFCDQASKIEDVSYIPLHYRKKEESGSKENESSSKQEK